MMRRAGIKWLAALVLSLSACDDQQSLPDQIVREAQERAAELPLLERPTTQELVEGPRVSIILDALPLLMQVPPQWRITRHSASVVWLEGPTPSGDARIALKHQDAIPRDQFEMYLKGSRRDQQEDQNTFIDIRQVGPMHIVERRTVLRPVSTPLLDPQGIARLDEKGNIVMLTSTPMRWWLNVFVPFEDHVEQYDLNFVVITREQYEVDGPMLEKMLSTLQYIGPQPVSAPSDPTTGPASR